VRAATRKEIAAAVAASGPGAVEEASRAAVGALGAEVGLLIAFSSGELDFDASAGALEEAAMGAPAAGMTGKGLITPDGPLDQGCVAMAFGTRVKAAVANRQEASRDLREAGRGCTEEALEALGTDPDVVLLFIDSSHGDISETALGAYTAAGPKVPLAGGAAGGAGLHLHAGEAISDSAIAIAISAGGALGVAERQSCETHGTPSIITRARGQVVEEIDGRPAEEAYLEQIGFGGLALDDEDFESMAITHPLAQPELHGHPRLRHVIARTGDGGIVLGTSIPAGAAIEFTELDFDDLLESGSGSVEAAVDGLGGDPPQAILTFDCAGRRRALREGLGLEVAGIMAAARKAPLAGLYTNGEVARLQGARGDRNHAVVTVAFG
jgi:hypothetical protein